MLSGSSQNRWNDVRKWILPCFSILMMTGISAPAQNPYIHHYTTFDGLPSNTVYYIYQDSKRFIWFATDVGVVRYDGTTFTNFRKNDGLSSNEVIRIKEDSSGRIWFFNLNSKLNYYWHNQIFNSENAPFLDSVKNKIFFIDFFQDKNNTIYFYNRNFEIYSLNSKNRVQKIETAGLKCKGDLGLRYLSKNSMGEFIVWTGCEIFKLSASFKNPVKIFASDEILKVYPGRNNSYFMVDLNHGVFKFSDECVIELVPIPFKKLDDYRAINSILEDSGGFLWIVTFDIGVYCIRDNRIVRHFDINEGQSVMQDNEDNVWISSMKDGVYKTSPYLNAHFHYENSLFQNMGITDLNVKPGSGLWITNGKMIGLLVKNDLYTLNYHADNVSFNQLYPLKSNTLIAGEKGYFFYAFEGIALDPLTKLVTFKAMSKTVYHTKKIVINKGKDQVIMFGGSTSGLYNSDKYFQNFKEIDIGENMYNVFYNFNDDLVINAKKNYLCQNGKLFPYDELSRFDNKIIYDHLILNDSMELLNVEGDSIYLHDRRNLYNLSAAFAAPIDLQVRNFIYDGSTLYLSTSRNVYQCDNPLDVIRKRKVHLHLLDINFRNIHDILVNNDSLYIASDDGLTIIPEPRIGKITTHIPIPYFQSILINDKETDYTGQGVVSGNNNKITINYSCINYSSTPILYSYKLIALDSAWTTGTSRNVVYQSLKRGNYVFQLRVRKPSAEWSVPVECRLIVKAAFWQRPLFYLSLFLLFTGLLIFFIIRRKNIQMKRREIDHQLITLEQKALQSMMNPHFIFNSLGSIQNYLLQKKSGEAALYLSQFARLIRQNLNAINSANINLEEEVDRLKNYLDLEKLRMEDKFEYIIEVDENLEADEILIPSMIIQPFVENAIWHGISTLQEKGLITIRFRKMDHRSLKISIKDNGIGMKKSMAFSQKSEKHFHLGMDMTRRRLELLGQKHSIDTSIESCEASPGLPNPGTRVVLVVPIFYSEAES
jgi:hypothetical protein